MYKKLLQISTRQIYNLSNINHFRDSVTKVNDYSVGIVAGRDVQLLNKNQPQRNYCYFDMKPKIYITRSTVPQIGIDLLKDECDVFLWNSDNPVPRDELLRNVVGVDGLYCTLTDKIDVELLEHAGPNLKVIGTMSVGFDHIDVAECRKRGIRIGYTPDVLTDATAELTLALLLATSRRLIEANKEVYNGGWRTWSPFWMCGNGLKNSTVGLFGFGRIGQEVAKRIVPFKPARIIYTSRSERYKYDAEKIGVTRVDFDELLSSSDFIIAACAFTPETKELFNENVFSRMRSNSIFINISRGGCVDQEALYNALRRGTIKAAGLDVTTPEPIPLNHPLLSLSNCVILPHIGSADIETRIEMSRITACNILAGLKGIKMHSEL